MGWVLFQSAPETHTEESLRTTPQPKIGDLKVVVRMAIWEKPEQLLFLSSSMHHIVNIL